MNRSTQFASTTVSLALGTATTAVSPPALHSAARTDGPEVPAGPVLRRRVVEVQIAKGFFARASGLLFGKRLADGVGLLFSRTRCVHGFGMFRRIDLVFLDDASVICRICSLAPWQVRFCRHASAVIEFEAGQIDRHRWYEGDPLELIAIDRCRRTLAMAAIAAAGTFGLASATDAIAQMTGAFSPAWVARFEARAESLYQAGEDAAAIQAWETVSRMDPARQPHSTLRIGNVHQRNARYWEAIEFYRRLQSLPGGLADDGLRDVRRKGLANLHGLLSALAESIVRELDDPATAPVRSAGPIRWTAAAAASRSPASASAGTAGRSEQPSADARGFPRVEYLPGPDFGPRAPIGAARYVR